MCPSKDSTGECMHQNNDAVSSQKKVGESDVKKRFTESYINHNNILEPNASRDIHLPHTKDVIAGERW